MRTRTSPNKRQQQTREKNATVRREALHGSTPSSQRASRMHHVLRQPRSEVPHTQLGCHEGGLVSWPARASALPFPFGVCRAVCNNKEDSRGNSCQHWATVKQHKQRHTNRNSKTSVHTKHTHTRGRIHTRQQTSRQLPSHIADRKDKTHT